MRRTAACVVVLTGATAVAAQQPTFRTAADAVTLYVEVRQGGRTIADLDQGDFEVRDNGVIQQITGVASHSGALQLHLLVDASDSFVPFARQSLHQAVSAARQALEPHDDFRLYSIASAIEPLAEASQPSVERRRADRGHTALLDALAVIAIHRGDGSRRPLMIALTDGIDTNSLLDPFLVGAVVATADVPIVVIRIDDVAGAGWRQIGPLEYFWFLRFVGDQTGGGFHQRRPGRDITGLIQQAMAAARARYVLTYVPTSNAPGWHAVDVRIKRPARFQVEVRRGYYRF